ncbi:MAG: molybdopterin-binding protein, partial [Desulfovibrio sp.]|nr:molybdopterin-binding protein [Desulfovibrio sp.]
MIQTFPVEEAVGKILCHDLTRIVPGVCKGPAFRKGHVIRPEDIPELLRIGKEHIFALDLAENQIHEDEAALRIARAVAGPNLSFSEVSEGRVNILARPGLLTVNVAALNRINAIENVALGTLHTGQYVSSPRAVAGTRVVPLVVKEDLVRQVEAIAEEAYPVIAVKPLARFKVGVVTTGGEIYLGRIEDKFGPVLRRKFKFLGSEVMGQTLVGDDPEMTRRAIEDFLALGADMIAVTGGMSVDPDDQTPASIRATGADVVTYGSPTFPGVMFMLAYKDGVPILGLPGCVMYYRASIFDLVVPRLLAGEQLIRRDIVEFG